MEIIFIIGSVQAFFIGLLIFSKNPKSTGDYVLGFWHALIGFHLLSYYWFTTGQLYNYPSLFTISTSFPLLQGPFLFVYVLSIIDKENRFRKKYWIHVMPFLLYNIFMLYDFHFLSFEGKLAYIEKAKLRELPILLLINYLNVFLGPVYLVLSLFKLRKHQQNINEVYSYRENIDLKWLWYVLTGMGVVWITVVIAFSLSTILPMQVWEWLNHSIYLAVTFCVFFMGYFGLKQKAIFYYEDVLKKNETIQNNPKKKSSPALYEKSGLKPEDAIQHLERLKSYMDTEKPYLNGKLSLKEVADALDISPNHLSEIINGQLNQNFFDFVNGYRVNLVKEKMVDPHYNNYSLLGVAIECGFNSKSSFNAIFKKATGKTPTEYLKAL